MRRRWLCGLFLLLSPRLDAQEANLLIAMDPVGAIAGAELTYTFYVADFGAVAQNVVITDVLPSYTTFVSAQPAPGWRCDLETVEGKEAVRCATPFLAPPPVFTDRTTMTIVLRVAPDLPFTTPKIVNTATISSDTPESRTTDNTATVLGIVDYYSDLSLHSSVSAETVPLGSAATIALDLENLGPSEAWYTTLRDTLPPSFSFLGIDAPGWSCATPAIGSSGEIFCQRDRFFPGSYSVRIFVRADHMGQGENVATIGDGSADLTSDDRSALARLEVVAPSQIPTLAPVGLCLLGVALAGTGLALLRARTG